MLSKYDVPNVSVGVVDIKSHTSEVSGIKDMVMTTMSSMAQNSKVLQVVSYGRDQIEVSDMNDRFKSPDFFIRISAPQIDKSVQFDTKGGGLEVDLENIQIGGQISVDRMLSSVSLDINMGIVRNMQLIPGVYSKNTIAMERSCLLYTSPSPRD